MDWIFFIAAEIIRNYGLIKWLKLRPHYGWCKIIRFFGGMGYLFAHYPDPATTAFPAIVYCLFMASSFYVSFDLILNLLRGKAWDYRGADSGKLDKLSDRDYYLLKAASAVVLVLSLIVMYGR